MWCVCRKSTFNWWNDINHLYHKLQISAPSSQEAFAQCLLWTLCFVTLLCRLGTHLPEVLNWVWRRRPDPKSLLWNLQWWEHAECARWQMRRRAETRVCQRLQIGYMCWHLVQWAVGQGKPLLLSSFVPCHRYKMGRAYAILCIIHLMVLLDS